MNPLKRRYPLLTDAERRHLHYKFSQFLIVAGCLIALAGAAVLTMQALGWLKFGVWGPVSVADALYRFDIPYPVQNLIGLQKIIDWMLDLPVSLVLMLLGVVIAIMSEAYRETVAPIY
jgi:hypothetical protein